MSAELYLLWYLGLFAYLQIFRRNVSSRGSFRDDPQLQQYFLDEINPTGKLLGVGSYGSVVEVNIYAA